jgi:hypothetical protein
MLSIIFKVTLIRNSGGDPSVEKPRCERHTMEPAQNRQ